MNVRITGFDKLQRKLKKLANLEGEIELRCSGCQGTEFIYSEPIADASVFKCRQCGKQTTRTGLVKSARAKVRQEIRRAIK